MAYSKHINEQGRRLIIYTDDPVNSVTDRIRLKVGDIDNNDIGLSNDVYAYLYELHGNNENRAALEALKMLVFKYANLVDSKAGGLEISDNQRYKHYKDLLDTVTKNPTSSFIRTGTPYAGGINKPQKLKSGEMYKNSRNLSKLWRGGYGI